MEAFFQLLAVVGGILLIIIAFAKAVFWYEAKKERGKCSVETYRKFKQARDIYHTCLIIGESGRARKIMDYWEDRVEQEGGPQAKNQAAVTRRLHNLEMETFGFVKDSKTEPQKEG